jgi:hypothetical protein
MVGLLNAVFSVLAVCLPFMPPLAWLFRGYRMDWYLLLPRTLAALSLASCGILALGERAKPVDHQDWDLPAGGGGVILLVAAGLILLILGVGLFLCKQRVWAGKSARRLWDWMPGLMILPLAVYVLIEQILYWYPVAAADLNR